MEDSYPMEHPGFETGLRPVWQTLGGDKNLEPLSALR